MKAFPSRFDLEDGKIQHKDVIFDLEVVETLVTRDQGGNPVLKQWRKETTKARVGAEVQKNSINSTQCPCAHTSKNKRKNGSNFEKKLWYVG